MTIFIAPAAAPIFDITYTYSLPLNGNKIDSKIKKVEIKKDKSMFLLFPFIQETSFFE
jgi:hypothetical protein